MRNCFQYTFCTLTLTILCTALIGCRATDLHESAEEFYVGYVATSEPLPRVDEGEVVVELLAAFQLRQQCYVWLRTNAAQQLPAYGVASNLLYNPNALIGTWSATLIDGTEAEVRANHWPSGIDTRQPFQSAYPTLPKLTSNAWSSVALVKVTGIAKRVSSLRPVATKTVTDGRVMALRFIPPQISVQQR
jgi:hypothetical protein